MHTGAGFSLFFFFFWSSCVFLFFNENRLMGWALLWLAFSWRGMCCLCLPVWVFPCQESCQETLTWALTKPVWKDGRNVPQSHHEKEKKKCTSQSRQYFLKPSLHYSLHGNLLLYFTLVRFIILLCGAIKYFFFLLLALFLFYLSMCVLCSCWL